MNDTIRVIFNDNTTKEYKKGINYYEISKDFNNKIIGVKVNNEIVAMDKLANNNDKIEFFDASDINGYKMNQSGLKFVLEVALKETFGANFEVIYDHSIARGLHMTINSPYPFSKDDTSKLKQAMQKLIDENTKIEHLNVSKKELMTYYEKTNNKEKALNIHNVTNNLVSVYRLKNYINYFYTEMPYSTGSLNLFDLVWLEDNILVLLYPSKEENSSIPSYVRYDSVIKCFNERKNWLLAMDIPYLADLNKQITYSNIENIIRASEINYDNAIHDIVEDIITKKSKYVMMAGPSSSGKTTSTKKLALALRARGYEPLILSIDNYFVEREDTPKLENGEYDFESINALDLKLLNEHLQKLNNNETLVIPEYNFILGKKEYNNKPIKLGNKGIILMEGLHCLNDEMTKEIDNSLKYKIYISPFIALNMDKHNYISTTDLRLLRRIIRDNRTRGKDVAFTIGYWNTVRSGEEKYIYPFLENADKILNTALVYEIGVLKVFVEPLLYSVPQESPYYEEARRLINFLKGFFPIATDLVSKDSILREFIGGSSFE